jgi:alkylation response protein AidB-like acyl-CoA dehydrogenase
VLAIAAGRGAAPAAAGPTPAARPATETVERLLRDAKLMEIGGGTLEAHHRNVVRELEKRVRPRALPARAGARLRA